MPLNTRVGRCVTKLRKKYGYGKAIGICQHSTKQNYLTGKTMRKKKTSRRKNRSRKKRGGRKKKGGASKPDHIAIDIKDIASSCFCCQIYLLHSLSDDFIQEPVPFGL